MSGKRRVHGYDYLYEVGRSLVVRVQVPASIRLLLKARSEFNMGRGRVEKYRRRANGKYLPIHKERPPTGSLELEDR